MSKETPGENHMMIWLFSVSFEYSLEVNDDIISFKHEFYDPFNIENKTRKIKKKTILLYQMTDSFILQLKNT